MGTQLHQCDEIFKLLKENKPNEAIDYVNSGKLREIDCTDENGTTPLQYSAFKGHFDLCKLLINKGADVNAKTHDQGYSALMFAAIANKASIVSLLLDHDADVDYRNQIGRSASQMAAFVNSTESADLIRSYVSKKSLEYFTEIHSPNEAEPKLPKGACLNELHNLLINSTNYSPVKIIKSIRTVNGNVLLKNMPKIINTLNAFVAKEFKVENECPNDLLAFKLHYYKYIFEYLSKQRENLAKRQGQSVKDDTSDELDGKLCELCIKQMLVEEEVTIDSVKSMKRIFEEKFLRESIRQFPYKECALVRQMVTILSKVPIGGSPSALYVITSCLNGQTISKSIPDDWESSGDKRPLLECATCNSKSKEAKMCTHCKKVAYCDQFCQKMHWPVHKKES
jgi:ankyrin repeat and MYND domain-containing protein 2